MIFVRPIFPVLLTSIVKTTVSPTSTIPPAKSSLFDQVFNTFKDGSAPVASLTSADIVSSLPTGSYAVTVAVFITCPEAEAVSVIS